MTELLETGWNRMSGFARWTLLTVLAATCIGGVVVATVTTLAIGQNDAVLPSYAYLRWGAEDTTDGDKALCLAPTWFVGAFKIGGEWNAETPAWTVDQQVDRNAILNMVVNRGLLATNAILVVNLYDQPGASLFLNLCDVQGKPVETNLYGNLLLGKGSAMTIYLGVPLADYPAAACIQLRRGQGAIAVYDSLLCKGGNGDGIERKYPKTPETQVPGQAAEAAGPEAAGAATQAPTTPAAAMVLDRAKLAGLQDEFHEHLGPISRKTLLARLKNLFGIDAGNVDQLSADDFIAYVEALWCADGDECRKLIGAWFASEAAWAKSTAKQLAHLAALAAKIRPRELIDYPLSHDTLNRLAALIQGEIDEGAADFEMLADMAKAWLGVYHGPNAQVWAAKACDLVLGTPAKRAAVAFNDARAVAELLKQTGTMSNVVASTQLANAAVSLAARGQFILGPGDAERFAPAATTTEGKALLMAALNVGPDLGLAKVVGSGCRMHGSLLAWKADLNNRIAGSSGDTKALWLLARGHMDAYLVTPANTLRRFAWIKQAEKHGQSDVGKRMAVRERANFYRERQRPQLALKLLKDSSDSGGDIPALLAEVQEETAGKRRDDARKQISHAEAVRLASASR